MKISTVDSSKNIKVSTGRYSDSVLLHGQGFLWSSCPTTDRRTFYHLKRSSVWCPSGLECEITDHSASHSQCNGIGSKSHLVREILSLLCQKVSGFFWYLNFFNHPIYLRTGKFSHTKIWLWHCHP